MNGVPVVEARGISKRFPGGVVALEKVDFELYEKEIVALLGENGSGKSTLVKILAGVYTADEGVIRVRGREVTIRNPHDAIRLGIVLVSQTPQLIERLTVTENIAVFLSAFKKISPITSMSKVEKFIESEASKLGIHLPPRAKVHTLSYTQKQLVEIFKAVISGASVLLLDEALTYLPTEERRRLYKYVVEFKEKGGTVVVITHKISEALEVADRVVVLKEGKVRGVLEKEKANPEVVRTFMFGEHAGEITYERFGDQKPEEELALVVKDLFVRDDYGKEAVKGVSIEARKGEIVGIAGIAGNGQKELLEAIAGLRRIESGKVYVREPTKGLLVDVTNRGTNIVRSLGVGIIPENTLLHGISVEDSIVMNIAALFSKQGFLIDWRNVCEIAKNVIKELRVLTKDEHTPCKLLSGGNIMKVVVGRELLYSRNLLLAYNPTRALDEVTAVRVRRTMFQRALNDKLSVLLVSEDLDEILQVSSTIYVMNSGKLYGPFDPARASRSEVEKYMVM